MTLFHVAIPYTWPRFFKTSEWENEPVYLIGALIWTFTTVAFAFYLRYVGSVEISLYVMFKLVIMCLVPVVILQIYYTNKSLRRQVKLLQETVIHLRADIPQDTENKPADTLELGSENWSEQIILKTSELIMIKSADNYIEIIYLENGQYRKKLIRNTLRNIEDKLGRYPDFIRCHRTSIVNILFIDKLISNYAGYKLQIRDSEEKVPVSRQYILKVKEALAKR
jgi:DNA-binding LytR/AlgR family response regulator